MNKKRRKKTHLLANLDRVPSPAWKKNTIPSLDLRRDNVAVLVTSTRANSDDSSLWERAVRGRTRKENTGGSFLQDA